MNTKETGSQEQEHTAKRQRLLSDEPEGSTHGGGKENASPNDDAHDTPPTPQPRQWERFLRGGEGRGPIILEERFDKNLLQRVMSVHKGEIWKDTIKQANTMLRKATNGVLKVTYEQTSYKKYDPKGAFEGCHNLGRYYAKSGGSMQGVWHIIRNTLAYDSYFDIDMANAFPTFAAQLFGHLQIPVYLSYAKNRHHFIEEFTTATGLGAAHCKKVVSSIMNGSHLYGLKADTDWKEMWANPSTKQDLQRKGITSLEGLNDRLKGVEFLASLRVERDIIFQQIQRDYPAFYDMCSKKAKAAKKNAGGVAFSLLMGDIENECLMVMLSELRRLKILSDEVVLAFDGMMIPKAHVSKHDLPCLMTTLEEAVRQTVGFMIKLVDKPMQERFEVVGMDAAAMLRDTTKGGRAMLGRCIRRLSATHEAIQREMTDLAIERSSKKKQVERLRANDSILNNAKRDDKPSSAKKNYHIVARHLQQAHIGCGVLRGTCRSGKASDGCKAELFLRVSCFFLL